MASYKPPADWEYQPQSAREELEMVLGSLADEQAVRTIVGACGGWDGVIRLLDRLHAGDERGFWQAVDRALGALGG
jgi:hypothetical protein